MMLVREFCHGGAAKPTTLSLNSGVSSKFNCCPGPSETYHQLVKTNVLQSTKLAHIQQIGGIYVPRNLGTCAISRLRCAFSESRDCIISGLCNTCMRPWDCATRVCDLEIVQHVCAISRLRKPSVRNLKIALHLYT